MRYSTIIGLFILIGISCTKPPKYPDTPSIEFDKISAVNYKDSNNNLSTVVNVDLKFKDGTGDLGLEQNDTIGLYNRILSQKYINNQLYYKFNRNYMNFWLDIFVKRNGQYVQVKSTDSLHISDFNFYIFDGRFKPFIENYKDDNHPIEGLLSYKFTITPILDPSSVTFAPTIDYGDSVKFEVRILDRKLNISNKVTTNSILVLTP